MSQYLLVMVWMLVIYILSKTINVYKEEYVCAAGISPSGAVHIGNFRDIATSYYVVRALQKLGKKARLLFSWDEEVYQNRKSRR